MSDTTANLLYLATIVSFIVALRFLSSPRRARLGNLVGAGGMLLAIVVTLLKEEVSSYGVIAAGMAIGAVAGAVSARRVRMTAMPQMVALFNGVGGGAAALVSLAEFHELAPLPGEVGTDESIAVVASALIGSVSFAGSMVAFAKLQELIGGRPITYRGQKAVNGLVIGSALALGVILAAGVDSEEALWGLIAAAAVFGVMFVLPIGGADMPVVISLLNAFTGLAAAATGFVLAQQRPHRERRARRRLRERCSPCS